MSDDLKPGWAERAGAAASAAERGQAVPMAMSGQMPAQRFQRRYKRDWKACCARGGKAGGKSRRLRRALR